MFIYKLNFNTCLCSGDATWTEPKANNCHQFPANTLYNQFDNSTMRDTLTVGVVIIGVFVCIILSCRSNCFPIETQG